ncbi:MAG: hypothetical protein R3E97_06705 [Candidatus Eisenbacteria bacterium]
MFERLDPTQSWTRIAIVLAIVLAWLPVSEIPADAGPHRDGRLVLHVVPDLSTTRDGEDRDLRSCESAVTSLPGDESPVVIFVLAAFPDWVSPSMAGVLFGISYTTEVAAYGKGPDVVFELPTTDWPSSGSGTALTFDDGSPVDDRLSTVYWFLAYAYQGTTFEIIENPAQGGPSFADNSVPSELDDVRRDDRGKIGFGVPGYNPCLANVPTGACCYETGVCVINAEVACEDDDGVYLGDDEACDPYACVGACCYLGDCTMELPLECERIGGWFRGIGLRCGSNTVCLNEDVTWGELKKAYREGY